MRLKIIFLCLMASFLLTESAYIIDSSSSEESSEESSEDETKKEELPGKKEADSSLETDDDVTDDCQNRCVQQELRNNNLYTQVMETACRTGCEAQEDILALMQLDFPKTGPAYLLGTAVDKCWDSCLTKTFAEGSQFCITGCSAMKSIQVAQIEKDHSEDSADDDNVASYKEEEIGNVNSVLDNEDHNEAEATETVNAPVVWRIYLVKTPLFEDYVNSIWNQVFRDLDVADDGSVLRGQKDDNSQLSWPFYGDRSAALTSDGNPSVYDQVSSSFEQLRDNFDRAVEAPGFQENLFFVLLGLTGLLILSSVFNSVLCPKRTESEQDHYYLPPGEALPVKLPSYDECMNMSIVEQEYKINLSLPVVAVAATEKKTGEEGATGGEEEDNKVSI